MINNTLIEKIVFTSYISSNIINIFPSLDTDTCNYLKNIINKNTKRNIILEITNNINDKELDEISEL